MAEKSLTLRPWNSPVRRSFLPSCFPQILLHYPPHSCNFMFSPSKKQKVDKQSKQTNQKRKKKKINKKTHIQSPFYVSQLLLGVGPTLAHSGRAQQDSSGENCFPFLSSSIAPAFLVEVPLCEGLCKHLNHRVLVQERQERRLTQQDSVDSFCSNFWSLTPGGLF